LGQQTNADFKGRLPFLFKILAAASPLSIQAHPNLAQAAHGYAAEEAAGVPFDARHRNYKDPNHKPELICALTPFWALKGFRAPDAISELFGQYNLQCLQDIVAPLTQDASNGLETFFRGLMTLPTERVHEALQCALAAAERNDTNTDPVIDEWLCKLHATYPGDVGVLAPLYLHLLQLQPGEALYLGAGELHAYVEGTGIEIMANSDNVLRGGLTPKHVDINELLKVLDFVPTPPERLQPRPNDNPAEVIYHTPAPEFQLSRITLQETHYTSPTSRSVEIFICIEGNAAFQPAEGPTESLQRGRVLLVPAAQPSYTLSGSAVLYKATVPG
jgi:mannose-6-phosphate isomerase